MVWSIYLWSTTFLAQKFSMCPEERGLCSSFVHSSLLNSPNQHRTGQWSAPGEATSASWWPGVADVTDAAPRSGDVMTSLTGQSCEIWWTRGQGGVTSQEAVQGWELKAGETEASRQEGRGRPHQGLWRSKVYSDWWRMFPRQHSDWSVTEAGRGHYPMDWS